MSHTMIESVDSICRDSTETQYMVIKNLSKSQSNKLTRFITMYHSSSSIFIANKIHSGTKYIAKEPYQKVTKWPKSSSSVHFFKTFFASYTEQWTPITFSQLRSLTKRLKPVTQNYGFIYDTIFFTCTHVHKTLSNETYSLLKITEIEIRSVCMET